MISWRELSRRLRDPTGTRADKGWAGRSLEAAIVRPALIGVAILQAVIALAAVWSTAAAPPALVLATLHLTMAVAAIVMLRVERGALLLVTGSWALFVADWTVAPTPESTMLFAACWLCNLTDALPIMLLRGRLSWQVPIAAAVAMPVSMALLRPEWLGVTLLHGVPITVLAITLATRLGMSYLVDYTDSTDAEARALEARTAALTIRKAATHQAAEDARVLHDTAINTLGAIASGGAAIADVDAVRSRCLADIAAIDALRSARADNLDERPGLRDAIRPTGIRVQHRGLSGPALAELEALLPSEVARAFSRAAAEAVQNAAKHSGADEVEVVIGRTEASMQMEIRDRGIGMPKHPGRSRGVARSILQRTEEAGIEATIDSAPGRGTTVTLSYRFDQAAESTARVHDPDRPAPLDALLQQLHARAVFALSAGLVGVGIALAALNHPGEATPEWLMVVFVAIACRLAWHERHRPALTTVTIVALIVAGPLAFLLSAWAVGFGLDRPYLWQAIGPIGPLLVLLIAPLPSAIRRLGPLAYAATVIGLATIMAARAPEAAMVTLVAGLIGLGLLAGVRSFMRGLGGVAARAHRAQRESFEVSLALAAVDAAATSRQRWRDAGLEPSVDLLRAIADGTADPKDPSVRRRCADEEAFLRQLSLLDPELIQMGGWFARALNRSRQRGIGLTVRAGIADATADDARRFGETLLTVVDALPSGTALTTALFASTQGLTMTLVAPTPHLAAAQARIGQWVRVITARTLGQQDLVEIAANGAPA